MKPNKVKWFFLVLTAFLILGIPFKVMVLIEGFTEIRPVNAIPPVAGLICGPVGALACGVGNVIADIFGTFNATSLLGFFGNLIAAYLPYRLWYIYADESPNLHRGIHILQYVFICFSAALTVAWVLSFGLYYGLGEWIEHIYTYVFFNNFGFSVGLGMPVLIMLTAEDVHIACVPGPKRYVLLKNKKARRIVPLLYTAAMAAVLIGVCVFHLSPGKNIWMPVLSLLGFIGVIMISV